MSLTNLFAEGSAEFSTIAPSLTTSSFEEAVATHMGVGADAVKDEELRRLTLDTLSEDSDEPIAAQPFLRLTQQEAAALTSLGLKELMADGWKLLKPLKGAEPTMVNTMEWYPCQPRPEAIDAVAFSKVKTIMRFAAGSFQLSWKELWECPFSNVSKENRKCHTFLTSQPSKGKGYTNLAISQPDGASFVPYIGDGRFDAQLRLLRAPYQGVRKERHFSWYVNIVGRNSQNDQRQDQFEGYRDGLVKRFQLAGALPDTNYEVLMVGFAQSWNLSRGTNEKGEAYGLPLLNYHFPVFRILWREARPDNKARAGLHAYTTPLSGYALERYLADQGTPLEQIPTRVAEVQAEVNRKEAHARVASLLGKEAPTAGEAQAAARFFALAPSVGMEWFALSRETQKACVAFALLQVDTNLAAKVWHQGLDRHWVRVEPIILAMPEAVVRNSLIFCQKRLATVLAKMSELTVPEAPTAKPEATTTKGNWRGKVTVAGEVEVETEVETTVETTVEAKVDDSFRKMKAKANQTPPPAATLTPAVRNVDLDNWL